VIDSAIERMKQFNFFQPEVIHRGRLIESLAVDNYPVRPALRPGFTGLFPSSGGAPLAAVLVNKLWITICCRWMVLW
jgi:hypothetical protein